MIAGGLGQVEESFMATKMQICEVVMSDPVRYISFLWGHHLVLVTVINVIQEGQRVRMCKMNE